MFKSFQRLIAKVAARRRPINLRRAPPSSRTRRACREIFFSTAFARSTVPSIGAADSVC